MVYILSRYTSVATNLAKKVLFEVGLSDNCQKKYFSCFKVNYLSFSKAEVSKFTTLKSHLQTEYPISKNDPMSNLKSFYLTRKLYIDSISTIFRNNLFTSSC